MSDSYTNLLYHIIFSTKNRQPFITPDIEPQLYDYIGGIIRGLGSRVPLRFTPGFTLPPAPRVPEIYEKLKS